MNENIDKKRRRLPSWLKRPMPQAGFASTDKLLEELNLNTVCRGAKCPNIYECFNNKTATFMILGNNCTRRCRFCAVGKNHPDLVDLDEPTRVAEASRRLGLRHVVITSVTRDDIEDGGASHFAKTVDAVRLANDCTVEVLIPDFQGSADALKKVLDRGPDVLNHNVETVPRLYKSVRPKAQWSRSLEVLSRAADHGGCVVKSGIMLGLGETDGEIEEALQSLLKSGASAVTIGQYLKPNDLCLDVEKYYTVDEFDNWHERAIKMGFKYAPSGPFVRSSYRAGEMAL